MVTPILEAQNVSKAYPIMKAGLWTKRIGEVAAVADVSLALHGGEAIGIVGASGSGKSTLGRLLTRLERPTGGAILFRGEDVAGFRGAKLTAFRRAAQVVFQDPYSSLNPSMSVQALVSEPWRIHRTLARTAWSSRVDELLLSVGIDPRYRTRKPNELSGGERQRVGIARALALEPEVLICDEPVSALDVSVQAQILVLLDSLQRSLGLACIFISHDLTVVRYVAQRVAVMAQGRIVEVGPRDDVFERPSHEFTRRLLANARRLHGAEPDHLIDNQQQGGTTHV